MGKRWLWWVPAVLLGIGLYKFTASPVSNNAHTIMLLDKFDFLPAADINILAKIIRKFAHLFSFGILALLIRNALHPYRWTYPIAWLMATLYGASDEIHQIYVPGRTPLITDVMIDSLGALLVLSIVYLLNSKKRNLLGES